MIEKSLGGPPGTSDEIDADYRDRSPVFHLPSVNDLPVSIWAGVEDGHSGSVPIRHSLAAFNAIAEAFLARYLGGRSEPVGEDFKGSSHEFRAGGDILASMLSE